ncbi:hypothetical protein [Pigmentiphaga daeguensis]|uniref:Uncharacterized protein n=1 Tax=Pigmentiphaga daeguensis TaxID=414049 RepID=A0ABN1B8Y1_9BURK
MTTAKTRAPRKPGHAAAQAFYAGLQDRLEREAERQGAKNAVPSNIGTLFLALHPDAHQDFVEAIGALLVDMLYSGDPYPGRWDPARAIKAHKRAVHELAAEEA